MYKAEGQPQILILAIEPSDSFLVDVKQPRTLSVPVLARAWVCGCRSKYLMGAPEAIFLQKTLPIILYSIYRLPSISTRSSLFSS